MREKHRNFQPLVQVVWCVCMCVRVCHISPVSDTTSHVVHKYLKVSVCFSIQSLFSAFLFPSCSPLPKALFPHRLLHWHEAFCPKVLIMICSWSMGHISRGTLYLDIPIPSSACRMKYRKLAFCCIGSASGLLPCYGIVSSFRV